MKLLPQQPQRILYTSFLSLAVGTLTLGCVNNQKITNVRQELPEQEQVVLSQQTLDRAVNRVKPGLVRIMVVEPSYRGGREEKFVASGSGAIISEDGYIITNHHVAGKAVRIMCTMPNREEIPAVLIGTDPATDVAVIKLQPDTPRVFPVVNFGNSDAVRVGDPVLALGSPLGLSQSVTNGIISNTEMIIPSIFGEESFNLDGENVGELVRWFGHDAQIFGGNSGGPLVNLEGEIIGINEISFGLAGAIPGNLAKQVAEELIAKGTVERAYLGISINPLLKSHPEELRGVMVATVFPDSPAAEAGILPGDVIQKMGTQELHARFFEELPPLNKVLSELPLNQPVTVELLRNSEAKSLMLTPRLRPKAQPDQIEFRTWGITARDISELQAVSMARDTNAGVLITGVRSGGPADKAKPAIQRGDILLSLNNTPINNMAEFQAQLEKLFQEAEGVEKLVPVLVEFERDGHRTLSAAEVGIEPIKDPAREVQRPWIPVETQVLTRELKARLNLADSFTGVRVTRSYNDEFPIKVGDILTHLDGTPIEAKEEFETDVFPAMIRAYSKRAKPEVTLIREGVEQKLTIALDSAPQKSREMRRAQEVDFEYILREASFYDQQDPKLKGVDVRVVVDSVTDGGWASLGGLQVGDVVLVMDGKPITSIDEAKAQMEDIANRKPAYVVFKVRRGVETRFVEMEPFWNN
ncbi:MAG: PDZ domain-containing protein [Candidatus Sumerlaeia bacterium]|nr:PDZ domain-containing protein [Candidatus Sumerlaeia bacterium]